MSIDSFPTIKNGGETSAGSLSLTMRLTFIRVTWFCSRQHPAFKIYQYIIIAK